MPPCECRTFPDDYDMKEIIVQGLGFDPRTGKNLSIPVHLRSNDHNARYARLMVNGINPPHSMYEIVNGFQPEHKDWQTPEPPSAPLPPAPPLPPTPPSPPPPDIVITLDCAEDGDGLRSRTTSGQSVVVGCPSSCNSGEDTSGFVWGSGPFFTAASNVCRAAFHYLGQNVRFTYINEGPSARQSEYVGAVKNGITSGDSLPAPSMRFGEPQENEEEEGEGAHFCKTEVTCEESGYSLRTEIPVGEYRYLSCPKACGTPEKTSRTVYGGSGTSGGQYLSYSGTSLCRAALHYGGQNSLFKFYGVESDAKHSNFIGSTRFGITSNSYSHSYEYMTLGHPSEEELNLNVPVCTLPPPPMSSSPRAIERVMVTNGDRISIHMCASATYATTRTVELAFGDHSDTATLRTLQIGRAHV